MLRDGRVLNFDPGTGEALNPKSFRELARPDFDEDPALMQVYDAKPDALSLFELRQVIAHHRVSGSPKALAYELRLASVLAETLMPLVIIAFAVPLAAKRRSFVHGRAARTKGRIWLRMTGSVSRRNGVTAAFVATGMLATAAPATSAPPIVDAGALPPAAAPAPPDETEQRNLCTQVRDAADPPLPPAAQRILNFAAVWPLTRGAGQKVAVIDTGVSRHPRLPNLTPRGDYVSTGDGTDDCDARFIAHPAV